MTSSQQTTTRRPGVHHDSRVAVDADRPWAAAGIAIFAAVLLVTSGTLQILQGIVAIADDPFFVVTGSYTYDIDVTAWGWFHLAIGAVAVATGVALFTAQWWARILGITFAAISLIANFLWIPYYPLWALLIIALDVAIIWGISSYDRSDLSAD
jgi:hypothetical protein